ncbi:MAG: ATP-binding protein [Chloroflexota bacterium]
MTTPNVPFWSPARWRLHARTRLALWYSVLMAGTLVLVGAGALIAVHQTLYGSLDGSLMSRALLIQQAVEHEIGEGERGRPSELEALGNGLDTLRIWDRRGRLVVAVEDGIKVPLTGGDLANPPTTDSTVTEHIDNGTTIRALTHPMMSGGRLSGVVYLGRSTSDIEEVLARLRLLGLAGLVLALMLAGLGGTFLAGRALAPVVRVARTAESIGADDLSRRLSLDLPDDELGRLARAFDAMLARLEAAFERQRRFTADASHELRTPLGIIRSQIDVTLAQPRTPEHYCRALRGLRAETDRLTGLTEQLLALARADGSDSLNLVPLDLQDVVAEVGAGVAARARDHGVQLRVELGDAPEVRGDPVWLTQVLFNLLDNGLRHTPPGGQVTLSLMEAPDGNGAIVQVGDTGEGIAPEHLPHLFERFYRAEASRSRASGGAGLGLAICDWVARAHGGQLSVESAVGVGSSFELWLPAASPVLREDTPKAGARVTAA